MQGEFAAAFVKATIQHAGGVSGLDDQAGGLATSFKTAADECLNQQPVHAQRPWIRAATLDLIALRNQARTHSQYELEKALTRQIRQSSQRDRKA